MAFYNDFLNILHNIPWSYLCSTSYFLVQNIDLQRNHFPQTTNLWIQRLFSQSLKETMLVFFLPRRATHPYRLFRRFKDSYEWIFWISIIQEAPFLLRVYGGLCNFCNDSLERQLKDPNQNVFLDSYSFVTYLFCRSGYGCFFQRYDLVYFSHNVSNCQWHICLYFW